MLPHSLEELEEVMDIYEAVSFGICWHAREASQKYIKIPLKRLKISVKINARTACYRS